MTDNETGVSAPAEQTTPHATIILALSFFRSVIQSGEPWTEHCQETYRSARDAIDALGTPSVSAPANQVDARWKKLAMQAMRYLNAEQLAAATKAAGVTARLCGASNPLMEAPVSAPAEDRPFNNVDAIRQWASGLSPSNSERIRLECVLAEVRRLTAALHRVREERDRLAHWLNEVDLKAQHALNAAHTALPRSSTTRDAVVTAWDALDTLRDCLRAARAARTQPEGSNG